jgi:hypothetical protein
LTTHRRTIGVRAGVALGALTATMLFPLAAGSVASAQPGRATTVSEPQYGFSFSLPPKWTRVPLDAKDLRAMVSAGIKANPGIGNALDQQALQAAEKGVKVFAVGPSSGDLFPDLEIAVASATGAPTGSAFVAAWTAEVKMVLAESGATDITVVTAQIPTLGQTVEVTFERQVKTLSGGSILNRDLELTVERGGHIYVISVVSGGVPGGAAEDQAVARELERSWRW